MISVPYVHQAAEASRAATKRPPRRRRYAAALAALFLMTGLAGALMLLHVVG